MYADRVTGSMQFALDETRRRRKIQAEYNRSHGITPETIHSKIKDIVATIYEKDYGPDLLEAAEESAPYSTLADIRKEIKTVTKEMHEAARELAFEEAAMLRDKVKALQEQELQWL